jgi:FKBP-type peptidyl-prolyl cis-trans isomerase FklB
MTRDVIPGTHPPESMRAVLVVAAFLVGVACATNSAGLKFLEENKGKEGVVTLASGLQYKVLNKGHGAHHPTATSPCECHYSGTLIDGTKL